MTLTDQIQGDVDTARARWQRWREERNEGLAAPYDWLSVVAYHWITATSEERSDHPATVPGGWWVADDTLHVRAASADGLVLLTPDGGAGPAALDGVASVVVDEAGAHRFATVGEGALDDDGPVLVEVLRRGGYYALRLRDPQAGAREEFTGVPVFDFNPDWVVDVELQPYEQPRSVRVKAAAPGLEQVASAVGEVVFHRGGREHRAVATARGSAWLLSFSDATSGVLTSAWRAVPVEGEVASGRGVIDFNRAINYPYVFSDYGTCPAPIAGNHLDLEVTAGEKAPTGRTGVPPAEGGPTALPGKQLLP